MSATDNLAGLPSNNLSETLVEDDVFEVAKKKFKLLVHNCLHCGYSTRKEHYLKKHVLAKHSGNEGNKCKKTLKCPKCAYCTTSPNSYSKHLKCKIENLYKCTQCKYGTHIKRKFELHLMKHKQFKCVQCNFVTLMSNDLKRHIYTEHLNMLVLHRCHVCTYKTGKKHKFDAHLRKHVMQDDSCISMKCNLCDFQSKFKYKIKGHLINAHKDCTEYNGKILFKSKNNLKIVENPTIKLEKFQKFQPETTKIINDVTNDNLNNNVIEINDLIEIDCVDNNIDDVVSADDDDISVEEKGGDVEEEMQLQLYNCVHCLFATKTRHYLNEHIKIHM